MPGIVETLPVKTRLALEVWALAGFVTLFSLVTSVAHLSSLSDGASPVSTPPSKKQRATGHQFERSPRPRRGPSRPPSPKNVK